MPTPRAENPIVSRSRRPPLIGKTRSKLKQNDSLSTRLCGFWIGTPIVLFLFLRYDAKESLILSLMITAGVWSVMYFILVILLSQIIFEGYITNFIYDTYIAD